jgi:hypothetical protein
LVLGGFDKIVGELKITIGLWGQECRMHCQIMKTIKRKRLNEEVTSEFILENLDDYQKKGKTTVSEHYSNEF